MGNQINKIAISKKFYKLNNLSHFTFQEGQPISKLITEDITTKIAVFEDRFKEWFIEVGKRLKNDNEAGFVILMIIASSIEGLAQYEQGESSKGSSKRRFREQFRKMFAFPEDISEIMYESMRCGLFHDTMTRKGIMINSTIPYIVTTTSEPGTFIINPHMFLEDVEYYFENYIKRLRDPVNVDARAKFEKIWDKFNSIERVGQNPRTNNEDKDVAS